MLEHLLKVWTEVARQLGQARHVLLLTDYDGTLTPITETPELAVLSEYMRWLIQALARQYFFTVGIISGRAMDDLKDKVGISGIIYAGNHGLEIEGPGITFVNPVANELKPILNVIYYVLNRTLGTIRGVFVENKGLSLSVHYRQVKEPQTKEVENVVKKVVGSAEAMGQAKITSGKKVYEVRPAVVWDKGKAIKHLMKRYGKGGRKSRLFPMYFGDDLTDEDGFKVINAYGMGLSVFIGEPNQSSAARYFLKSPDEMAKFIGILLEGVKQGLN